MTALLPATLAREFIEMCEPAGGKAVPLLRRAVRDRLHDWGIGSGVIDDALLVVSELLTNALRHGRLRPADDLVLRLAIHGGMLRIEVDDHNFDDEMAAAAVNGSLRESGHGLLLVAALAAHSGMICTHVKTVYADLSIGAGE